MNLLLKESSPARWATTIVAAACLPLLGSCYTQGETTCRQEDSPLAPLRGKVVDSNTSAPLGGSLVFVELCDLYSDNPDKAQAHPNYRYGAIADANGDFEVSVPRGTVGLHTFLPGYRYGSLRVADSTAAGLVVRTAPLLPADPRPKVANFVASRATVAPGEDISFRVDVTASSPKDPVSEEVLLVEPTTSMARAFNPPFRRTNDAFASGFPSGQWTARVPAPKTAGTYRYVFGMTSENCIVSELLTAEIVVQ